MITSKGQECDFTLVDHLECLGMSRVIFGHVEASGLQARQLRELQGADVTQGEDQAQNISKPSH